MCCRKRRLRILKSGGFVKMKCCQERYEREMKEYKKSGGGADAPSSSSRSGDSKKKTLSPHKNVKSKEYVESSGSDSDDKPLNPKKVSLRVRTNSSLPH